MVCLLQLQRMTCTLLPLYHWQRNPVPNSNQIAPNALRSFPAPSYCIASCNSLKPSAFRFFPSSSMHHFSVKSNIEVCLYGHFATIQENAWGKSSRLPSLGCKRSNYLRSLTAFCAAKLHWIKHCLRSPNLCSHQPIRNLYHLYNPSHTGPFYFPSLVIHSNTRMQMQLYGSHLIIVFLQPWLIWNKSRC